jgi:cytochrome P450
MDPTEALAALVTPAGRRDPHPLYDALRAHGPVVRVRDGLVAVAGYTEGGLCLRHQQLLVQDAETRDSSRPDWRARSSLLRFADSMLYRQPPDHTRLRRLVAGAFTSRRAFELRPVAERVTRRLLDRMAELGASGRSVDFMSEFAFRLPVAVMGELLGLPERDGPWFRHRSATVSMALEGTTNVAVLDQADKAMDELAAYFGELVEQRRRRPGEDLVTSLVQMHDADGGRLSHAELVGNLVLLLVAGLDTTTTLLGQGLWLAFEHPWYAARLRTEPDFAPRYVQETLRYEPPIHVTTRWAAADLVLARTELPAGCRVLLLLAAANRDPSRFPLPHRFNPDRPDNRPLTFGGGIHRCLGAALARMEAEIALPSLLRRFPQLVSTGPVTYRDRFVVPGPQRLPVAF